MPLTLRRLAYRVAYRLLQVVWLLTRPAKTGVKCVLTEGDRILFVRHAYGSRDWDLPGGGVKRGESPAHAAAREMHEELGVAPRCWTELGTVRTRQDHRHDTIHLFGAELAQPTLTLDRAELEVAAWFDRGRLPELRGLSREILRHLPASATSGG